MFLFLKTLLTWLCWYAKADGCGCVCEVIMESAEPLDGLVTLLQLGEVVELFPWLPIDGMSKPSSPKLGVWNVWKLNYWKNTFKTIVISFYEQKRIFDFRIMRPRAVWIRFAKIYWILPPRAIVRFRETTGRHYFSFWYLWELFRINTRLSKDQFNHTILSLNICYNIY